MGINDGHLYTLSKTLNISYNRLQIRQITRNSSCSGGYESYEIVFDNGQRLEVSNPTMQVMNECCDVSMHGCTWRIESTWDEIAMGTLKQIDNKKDIDQLIKTLSPEARESVLCKARSLGL